MKIDLEGKVALVTGSTRGIGFAIARKLHAEGCKVILNGRSAEGLSLAMLKIPGAKGILGDLTEPNEARKIATDASKIYNQLDILVCNVGSGRSVPPGEETAEEWKRVMAINLFSTTNIVEATREILAVRKGVIVCISSICGSEVILDAPITYSVAKSALNAYVRGVSRPLALKGIRINAISPGNIIFEDSNWSKKMIKDEEVVKKYIKQNVALERMGEPEEIANLVVYLASNAATFATGAIWTLDGGQTRS